MVSYMKIAFGIIVILLLGRVARSKWGSTNVEKPEVISSAQLSWNVELRQYAPMIQAVVKVSGNQRQALNDGFRLLAGYIFGANTQKAWIAMTAPVGTQKNEIIAMTAPVGTSKADNGYTISFTIPSKYTLETLPTPDNNKVKFVEIPSKSYYVWSFWWRANEMRANRELDLFQKTLKELGITSNAQPILNQYNDPWTMPIMRLNERRIEKTN